MSLYLEIKTYFIDGGFCGCVILCKDFLKKFMCMSVFCLYVQVYTTQ